MSDVYKLYLIYTSTMLTGDQGDFHKLIIALLSNYPYMYLELPARWLGSFSIFSSGLSFLGFSIWTAHFQFMSPR